MEQETVTPLSLWKLPNSSTGMDTINRGGEPPHLVTCGTDGSSQTRRENSILCEDILGKNRARKVGLDLEIPQEIFRIFFFATQNCAFITT